MSTFFSAVIPLYNKAGHIERAVHSVLSQTFACGEVIIVDDGSIDGGGELAARIRDSRIRVIVQENAGVSLARNRGIRESRGSMVAFLDADDAWSPDFLEIIERLRRNHHGAGAYATAYEVVTRLGYRKKADLRNITAGGWEGIIPGYFKASALGEPPVSSSSVAVPKEIFDDVGYFNSGVRYGEDLDMWGRIALKYPVAFSSRKGAVHYQNAANRSSVKPVIHDEWCFIGTAKRALEDGQLSADDAFYLQEYMAVCRLRMARECILSGNRALARRLLSTTETSLFRKKKIFWSLLYHVPEGLLSALIGVKERAGGLRSAPGVNA